mmetsp:Transcript_61359/g.106716  ORF Transcript_61359/g.106716 Transcript_61359/m.106716 type:complete len:530 (-) Transcript_61359:64-1653(-)
MPEEPAAEAAPEDVTEEQFEAALAEVEGAELEEGAEVEAEAEAAEEGEEAAELDEEQAAAIEGADDGELAEVSEHLKDAVEGSFRMKRLLEGADEPDAKKAKITPEQTISNTMLKKWTLSDDLVCKYVLNNLPMEELETLSKSGYIPDKNHQWKSAADLLQRYVVEARERKGIGGGPIDVISAFKFRWQLDAQQDKALRALSHKDLRYVFKEYNGTIPVEDVIKEASSSEPEEVCTESAVPTAAGVPALGRFDRLELIDPCADAAVFGDANLTFAIRLVKQRKALGHVGRVIATTFEDLPTLRERYKEIDDTIAVLEDHYAEVLHSVDCTRIAVNPDFKGMEGSLGAVYYNFPHSGAVGGFFDGHPLVNWRHENLMRLFFRALRTFVKPGGIVKVASNMGAVGVRYSYIVGGALENEFVHVETMPFLEWHLHRYGRSYGDRRDAYKRPDAKNNESYNAQRAESDMVYCFVYAPSGETIGTQKFRQPPVLKTLSACSDGPFKNLVGQAKTNLAQQLHKRFVSEASGIHVG